MTCVQAALRVYYLKKLEVLFAFCRPCYAPPGADHLCCGLVTTAMEVNKTISLHCLGSSACVEKGNLRGWNREFARFTSENKHKWIEMDFTAKLKRHCTISGQSPPQIIFYWGKLNSTPLPFTHNVAIVSTLVNHYQCWQGKSGADQYPNITAEHLFLSN